MHDANLSQQHEPVLSAAEEVVNLKVYLPVIFN